MAANNYFGFAHGTTQYAAAAGTPAYQPPQAGYAVAQTAAAAAAATYTTQRAATGYDTYQPPGHTTPATYVAAGTPAPPTAAAYDYAGYARSAPTAYDASKSYYQQSSAASAQPYPSSAAAAAAAADYQVRAGAAAPAAAGAGGQQPAQHKPQPGAAAYTGAATGGGYTAAQPPPAQPATYTYTTPAATSAAVYSGAMYMNQGKPSAAWQGGYKKTGGGGGVKQMRAKPQPKPQQLHYCEVCKISCAGPQTYREHLEGQRHKKKEALQKEGGGTVSSGGRGSNNLRCELCDVVCTGSDAYAAHLRGAKHQKVVKLHTRLGKPIPEVDMKTAKAAAAAAATGGANKISFTQSGTLGSVKTEKDDSKEEPLMTQADIEMSGSLESEITPVGQEYIEEIKNEEGKLISFNCKLCECKFNDPNAKDMHMKGRRHRLQFKKKVNPDLIVDVKPSGRRGRMHQEDKLKRREDMLRRREEERGFWADRMVGDDRMYWDERRRFEEELEYMEWLRRHGPNFIQPHLPYGMRRHDTIDDRHFLAKHQAIFPKEDRLQWIHKVVSQVEKALKLASDQVCQQNSKPPPENASKKENPSPVKKEEDKKEENKDDSKAEIKSDDKAEAAGRLIRGVMRVGILAKNLILSEDDTVQLVILCSEVPSRTLLDQIGTAFQTHLKAVAPEDEFTVVMKPEESGFSVSVAEPKLLIAVTVTSPVIREILLHDSGEASGTRPTESQAPLHQAKCLEALAQLRRAKWFQARPGVNPSSVMVVRILRDLCSRNPTWTPLSQWACELLVDRVVGRAAFSGSEALRKVLEAIAGGVLLPGGPGVADPCEREPCDAAASLSAQQRADITASAQHALRLFAFRQIHKVLGIAQIVTQPRHPGGNRHSVQRFNRKRRRDQSAEENNDSEGGDGKKDKKEGEVDVSMEAATK